MQAFPNLVPEIRFLSALDRHAPHWPASIFSGTWLYWLVGQAFTRKPGYWSKRVLRDREPSLAMHSMRGGVAYSDAYLPEGDAHFVLSFIVRPWERGAIAVNYTQALDGRRFDGIHHTGVRDEISGDTFAVRSRVVLNAAGPWADQFNRSHGITTDHRLVFSRGIHLVVPQVTDQDRVLTFFAADDRPFFVFPLGDCSCVGTTDTRVASPETRVTEEDRGFVLNNINRYLKKQLTREDIISERCGVRPLVVDRTPSDDTEWTQLSRKHVLEVDRKRRHLTIFGGKLTDCLNVGEEVCDEVARLGLKGTRSLKRWFGEPSRISRRRFLDRLNRLVPGVDGPALWRRYGRDCFLLLKQLEANPEQARELMPGSGLLEVEVRHIAAHQMIVTLGDFFRRRTLLEMTRGRPALQLSKGAREICSILFGPAAEEKWNDYLQDENEKAE
jgi:glycerol-3-phosphate dehydrogenase